MSEREELEETALPAVLVRRSDLPVPFVHPGSSFFGGLPRLPPQFEWPRADVRANVELETVALTFVAQVDLADVPGSKWSPLPKRGTLFFFCSSVFVDEGNPPCRVLYSPAGGNAYPERTPPPDLMPLADPNGDAQVKWLDPVLDFHSKVEFKYPLSFRPFRDFDFHDDVVGGEVLIESLSRALGPGEPDTRDLLQYRTVEEYAKDVEWPFNWLLITHVVRSVLWHVRLDLTREAHDKSLTDEVAAELQRLRRGAIGWLERCRALTPLDDVDADAKLAFRAWWVGVAEAYGTMVGQVFTSAFSIAADLGHAINYTIRCLAAQSADACDDVPLGYLANLVRQNHWKAPTVKDGQNRRFSSAIHQMLGYGFGPQNATEEHMEDILLLQIQGDPAFFNWHANTGGVLHFWIDPDALAQFDFSKVAATYECD
ncbi:DUF1963 domain-containing protein [Bradyrhizobium cosmicum]|uniref:DUF1963 domain-containing protein n=1 Tax=Bradyrhizobium cosmicum TaxID=1404864 RepID=UPI0011637228|nr:DUF1963 domain-containing protein [Bradyrhizobium cosmicum]QDP23541.1 DUF1963 domain-containing protein [Bradyrhizobium cosmicum]